MGTVNKILVIAGMLLLLLMPVSATEAPLLRIGVQEPIKSQESISAGEWGNWYICCTFPEGAAPEAGYTLIQTLSPFLSFQEGSVEARLVHPDGTLNILNMEHHYSLTSGAVFTEQGPADRLSLVLTDVGCGGIGPGDMLRVSYRTVFSANAPVGTQIIGIAQLNYRDESGTRRVLYSNKAGLSTGGIHITAEDSSGRPLAGAEFMVARPALKSDIADPAVLTEVLDTGDGMEAVVYVPFWDSGDLSGETVYTAVTDSRGNAICYGLKYGTYYLVQTGGETGKLTVPPVSVTVNETSHITEGSGWVDRFGTPADNTVRIVNRGPLLPMTGGPGTRGYTVSGLLVICSACLLLWNNRKRSCTH